MRTLTDFERLVRFFFFHNGTQNHMCRDFLPYCTHTHSTNSYILYIYIYIVLLCKLRGQYKIL